MLISAELRWFWKGSPPAALQKWFLGEVVRPGGGKPREDEYLDNLPQEPALRAPARRETAQRTPGRREAAQRELGIKKRAGQTGVEIKGLVEVRGRLAKPFDGQVQIWTKWTTDALAIEHGPRVVVQKTRWLRKFDTTGPEVRQLELDADERLRDGGVSLPEQGCHVELVDVRVGNRPGHWSTFGFEAFGALHTVEESLQRTITYMTAYAAAGTAPLSPDALAGGLEASYPEWLASLAHPAVPSDRRRPALNDEDA